MGTCDGAPSTARSSFFFICCCCFVVVVFLYNLALHSVDSQPLNRNLRINLHSYPAVYQSVILSGNISSFNVQ